MIRLVRDYLRLLIRNGRLIRVETLRNRLSTSSRFVIDTVLSVKLCVNPLSIISATSVLVWDDLGLLANHLLDCHSLLLPLSALRSSSVVIVILSHINLGLRLLHNYRLSDHFRSSAT